MDASAAARVRSVRGMGRAADGATTVSIAATDVPPALRRMGRHRNAAATATRRITPGAATTVSWDSASATA